MRRGEYSSMNSKKKIVVHPLVYVLFVFCFFYGYGMYLFLAFLFVTLHELMHMASALLLGAKLSQIVITPVGQKAVIRDMERLSSFKRFLILILGPLSNITLGLVLVTFFQEDSTSLAAAQINFCIGFFNLLPVFPLDGGRISLVLLENRFGTLHTASFLVKLSRLFGFCMIFLGMVQAVLYPFNISLLIIGIYVIDCNRREYTKIALGFYNNLLRVGDNKIDKCMKIKKILVPEGERVIDVIKRFSVNYYYVVYYCKNSRVLKITQSEILKMAMEDGVNKRLNE